MTSDTLFQYESGYSRERLFDLQERLFDWQIQEQVVDQRRWVTVYETVYVVGDRFLMIRDERPSTEMQGGDFFWSKFEVWPHEVTTIEYKDVPQ